MRRLMLLAACSMGLLGACARPPAEAPVARAQERPALDRAALISCSDSDAKQPDGRYEWRVEVPSKGKKTLTYVVDIREPRAGGR